MKQIIVQIKKTFDTSFIGTYTLLSVGEDVKVNFLTEEVEIKTNKSLTFKCHDGHWQDVLRANKEINFMYV